LLSEETDYDVAEPLSSGSGFVVTVATQETMAGGARLASMGLWLRVGEFTP
jgi:hypothetical protein